MLINNVCGSKPTFSASLTLWPEREWFGVANEDHTFVVDADGEVFDLLLHNDFSTQYHHMNGSMMPLSHKASAEAA